MEALAEGEHEAAAQISAVNVSAGKSNSICTLDISNHSFSSCVFLGLLVDFF